MEANKNIYLKPRVGSVLSNGWTVLWDNFITLFLILLVVWVVSIPFAVMESTDSHSFISTVLGTFSFLYFLFVYMPISVSADFLYVKAIRNNKLDVKEILDVFNNYLNVVLAVLLQVAIIGIGFVFFIIPGVIFACRLVFVPYLVLDKKLDPVKAVEESWRLSRGYGWRILWLYIVSFFLIIAGLIVLIFGAVIAFMWINAAFAAFYQAVLEEKDEYEIVNNLTENRNVSNETVDMVQGEELEKEEKNDDQGKNESTIE
ncbi:MAG: hypothetical protein JEZ09_17410 [Salinivirgaceae bacterium]|nr:hypothetical protein [Salinivirgaceae bacterium]